MTEPGAPGTIVGIVKIREALSEMVSTSSAGAVAKSFGVSLQQIADVLFGLREPGPRILKALGIEREIIYRIAVTEPKRMPSRANGGNARRDRLTPDRRSQIARAAAQARWLRNIPPVPDEKTESVKSTI